MSRTLHVIPGVEIHDRELHYRYSRSGGPGGQNVNKVSSRVEVLFDVAGSLSLGEEQKAKLRRRLRRRIDAAGMLRVTADGSRSQWRNREDAVERLVAILRAGLAEQKQRVATAPSRAAGARRVLTKKKRGATKKLRARVEPD